MFYNTINGYSHILYRFIQLLAIILREFRFLMISAFISFRIFPDSLFLKCTIMLGSKDSSSLYPSYPRKYCRYGISLISSTSSSSGNFDFSFMMSAPHATRTGSAGRPLFVTNNCAYFSSTLSQGINSARITHRF